MGEAQGLGLSALPATTWRILALEDRVGLSVVLTVDTTAPQVVAAIERAAEDAGVVIVREPADADA